MFSTLRTRFGIPGVISVMALVFAMFGGAYAASNSSDGGKATASAKAKKGPRGPRGPKGPKGDTGPAGPQGPAGAKGDAGAAGANGKDGTNGTNGTNGANGNSVVVTAESAGANCEAGGVKVTVQNTAGQNFVCNGKEGGGGGGGGWSDTLPSGQTETGTFFATGGPGLAETATAISFPIPLKAADAAAITVRIAPHADCTGSADEPAAAPGALCIYPGATSGSSEITEVYKPSDFATKGVATSGALLFGGLLSGDSESGSFAITAPTAP